MPIGYGNKALFAGMGLFYISGTQSSGHEVSLCCCNQCEQRAMQMSTVHGLLQTRSKRCDSSIQHDINQFTLVINFDTIDVLPGYFTPGQHASNGILQIPQTWI